MNIGRGEEINVLRLSLHNKLVGYLVGFKNGRNVLSFASEFREDANRPTLSLITHPDFPRAVRFIHLRGKPRRSGRG
jgi:serine/threonine-protein kinase HipA